MEATKKIGENLPTAEELKALTDRVKTASATMMHKLSSEKHQNGVTNLRDLILSIAKNNCPEKYDEICLMYAGAQPYQKPVTGPAPEQLKAAAIVGKVVNMFLATFGYFGFAELPVFQQETMKALAMLHLGYRPQQSTDLNGSKAVYLCGKSQIGKTTVFEFLKETGYFKYRIVTSYDLSMRGSADPAGVIADYSQGQYLVIDEVGMEQTAKHFGATHDVVAEIIHGRYSKGLHTHFTSNYDVDSLPYDHHIKMRIKQGCNIIATNAEPFLK